MEDTDESVHESAKWTQAIDRGRLIHISDTLFSVFAEIELDLQRNLGQNSPDLSEVVECVIIDEKVLLNGQLQQ